MTESTLTVEITSFSFKKGIPQDESGNGGGFVFDCRALPNPGRYKEYLEVNGTQQEVIDFFKPYAECDEFFSHVCALVTQSVNKYVERGFTHLMINFGCTGGQHRSVYFAEKTAQFIHENFPVRVVVNHREQKIFKEL
ncbi:MAG: ATP-binding protein [Bacteroidales bacterium]|nr:ATP-binding protein [Bacteroidales bacterium]